MARVLSFQGKGGSLVMGEASGVKAGAKTRGFGMPGVALQWFEGAGDGASYRGGRTLPRVIDVEVRVYGTDRADMLNRYGNLARIFVQEMGEVTMTILLDGEAWRASVVRTGGLDYSFESSDTDGKTYLRTVLTVQAGDPYWTRVDSEARNIGIQGLGIPLIGPGKSLVTLSLSDMGGSGTATFENSGDVQAWPIWRFNAPFNSIYIAHAGQVLEWVGVKAAGWIELDTQQGTVTDETGANRYAGLEPAPRFFSIPPGSTSAELVLPGATGATTGSVVWHPRKVVVF
jgi:hypothetical protein